MQRGALLTTLAGVAVAAGLVLSLHRSDPGAACGDGFFPRAARCIPDGCPPPLAMHDSVCDAPDVRVKIPETTFLLGPSDWEAEGRVSPRQVHVNPFSIDAFEATIGHVQNARSDAARAVSGISRDEAAAYCANHGGRLPTEDEWLAAASGEKSRRYPWGDTGAVCRRAAWGLSNGPCAHGAEEADSVGSHASGDTPTGIHDMAGNVAEWVTTNDPHEAVARGGSYKTVLATELRTWERRVLPANFVDTAIGFRCAYDLP